MIRVQEEQDLLRIIAEADVPPEMMERALEPPRCRDCGSLLTPGIDRGRMQYRCRDCDATAESP